MDRNPYASHILHRHNGKAYRFLRDPDLSADLRPIPDADEVYVDTPLPYRPFSYLPVDADGVAMGLVEEIPPDQLTDGARAWVAVSDGDPMPTHQYGRMVMVR